MTDLSTRVIREDHRLERAVEQGGEELARHRWHWALDPSNPKRVPVREYARAVGRNEKSIRVMVNGYRDYLAAGGAASGTTLEDAITRQRLHGETSTAVEAVAKARGVSLETARRHHADEVRQVKATAQERVERSTEPVTIEEAVHTVAEGRAKGAATRKRLDADKRKRHTARYMRIEGYVASARRQVLKALTEAQDVAFTDEERELLSAAADELRAILNLIDLRIAGDANVDWDAELAKLSDQ